MINFIDIYFNFENNSNIILKVVEDIMKNREPLPQLEAINLIQPSADSIARLIDDFNIKENKYRAAHVFFTEACINDLFNQVLSEKT